MRRTLALANSLKSRDENDEDDDLQLNLHSIFQRMEILKAIRPSYFKDWMQLLLENEISSIDFEICSFNININININMFNIIIAYTTLFATKLVNRWWGWK